MKGPVYSFDVSEDELETDWLEELLESIEDELEFDELESLEEDELELLESIELELLEKWRLVKVELLEDENSPEVELLELWESIELELLELEDSDELLEKLQDELEEEFDKLESSEELLEECELEELISSKEDPPIIAYPVIAVKDVQEIWALVTGNPVVILISPLPVAFTAFLPVNGKLSDLSKLKRLIMIFLFGIYSLL